MITDPHKTTYVNVKQNKIPVWTYGKSTSPPIIFIHGLFNCFSEYVGDLPMRYLKKNYFVIAFDLPSFGKSKNIKINNLEFISEVQKQILKNKASTFLGASYGGLIALKYAHKYSNHVNKLIIAGTPFFFGPFNLYKLAVYFPIYRGKKVATKQYNEFKFLDKDNLKDIKNPVLLYYNRSDFIANVFMGKKLNNMLPNSKIFISSGLNHGWLLHRIDKNGLLKEIDHFLK